MLGAQAGRSRPLNAFWHSPAGEEDQHGPAARLSPKSCIKLPSWASLAWGEKKGSPRTFSLNTFDTVMIRCTSTLFSFSSSESRCECVLPAQARPRASLALVHLRMSLVRGVVRGVVRGSGASGGKRRIPRSTARRVHSRREATRKWHVVRPQRQRPLIRRAGSWVRTAAAPLPHSCRNRRLVRDRVRACG